VFTTPFSFKVVFKWNNKTPVYVYITGFCTVVQKRTSVKKVHLQTTPEGRQD